MWEKSSPLGANWSAPAHILGITISPFPWDAEGRNVLFPGLFSWARDFPCNFQKMQFTASFSFSSLNSCAIEKSTAQPSHSVSLIFFLSMPFGFTVEWTLTTCFATSFGNIFRILGFSFLARRFKIDLGILLASLQQQWALQQKQREKYNHRNKTELCARLRRMFN